MISQKQFSEDLKCDGKSLLEVSINRNDSSIFPIHTRS